MIKAIFIDFYGTLVHEDGAVIQQVSQEIFDTGKVENISEIDSYWWNEFQTDFTAAYGDRFGLIGVAERFRKVLLQLGICWKYLRWVYLNEVLINLKLLD